MNYKFWIFVILAVLLMGCSSASQEQQEGTMLTFDSFDGGGPDFDVVLDDPTIVSYTSEQKYARKDHDKIDGAAYSVIFTFTGLKAGETTMTVEERSPIAGNLDHKYNVIVNDDLEVSIEKLETRDLDEIADVIQPVPTIIIAVDDNIFYAIPEDNSSADEFVERLSSAAIEVDMHDYNNFEKVGNLPWELPRNDEEITTEPGDIILYDGNKLTIYYDQNTWNLTRLAKIQNVDKDELMQALGAGDIKAQCWVEWSE